MGTIRPNPKIREWIVLIAILLVALALRLWGLGFDLPYIYHPDEPDYIRISQNIFITGDLNPHFFKYPSLFFYIHALAYLPYYLLGLLTGVVSQQSDILPPVTLTMGVTFAQFPTSVTLGRLVTVLFGVLSTGLVYSIGRLASGKAFVAGLAALFVAVSSVHISHSRAISPDVMVTFFILAVLLASLRIYQKGDLWAYVLAGLCVGFTASTKYNGGLVIVTLIAAHFLRHGRSSFKHIPFYLALFLSGVGFLATMPYALLDFPAFWADLQYEATHYATGHAGMEGDTLRWYLGHMWQTAGMLYIWGAGGVVLGIVRRSKEIILVAVFPLVYFAFISSFEVRNDRTLLPMIPFALILAAMFFGFLCEKIQAVISPWQRRLLFIGFTLLLLAAVWAPLSTAVRQANRLIEVDSRETARAWINENLPTGSYIAIEAYSPFIDTRQFNVLGAGRIPANEPAWYVSHGFDYLVFAQGMYGRYFADPIRYQADIMAYQAFFERFPLVRQFNDGGYVVRIYQVTQD